MGRTPYRALSSINNSAWALPPIVRHRLDGVVRRAARGERDAVALLAREFSPQMIEHAAENLARFDMDAEDVVQHVLLTLLERSMPEPPLAACAVTWLLDRVALFAQPNLAA